MAWNNDDFVRDLMTYSEIETDADDAIEPAEPKTIANYNRIIKQNNKGSIFDEDYGLDSLPQNDCFDDADVTVVVSGRGKGGRRTFIKPVGQSTAQLDLDEEMQRQIRKVSGLGYSNELIVYSIEAQRRSKSSNATPNGTTHEGSPSSCSRTSTPATISTEIISPIVSENISPANGDLSSSSSKAQDVPDLIDFGPSEDSCESNQQDQNLTVAPPPMSEMLKACKNLRKKSKLNLDLNSNNYQVERKPEPKKKIPERPRRDNHEPVLSWRRRTNSPPRFAWGQMKGRLNINSETEFPRLK